MSSLLRVHSAFHGLGYDCSNPQPPCLGPTHDTGNIRQNLIEAFSRRDGTHQAMIS